MLRPQLNSKRDLVSLNGVWDLNLIGNYACTETKKAAVPSSFNDLYTDENIRNHHGEVKYSKKFKVGDSWDGKRIFIHFEAVSYRAIVSLNGIELGEHETGYTPFEFDVTDNIKFGEYNYLEVIVDQNLSADTIPQSNIVDKDWIFNTHFPNVIFDFYPYTGIHRNVFLYTVNETSIESIKVDTDIEKSAGIVTVHGSVNGNAAAVLLKIDGLEVRTRCY